jgi:hypothetical protein
MTLLSVLLMIALLWAKIPSPGIPAAAAALWAKMPYIFVSATMAASRGTLGCRLPSYRLSTLLLSPLHPPPAAVLSGAPLATVIYCFLAPRQRPSRRGERRSPLASQRRLL